MPRYDDQDYDNSYQPLDQHQGEQRRNNVTTQVGDEFSYRSGPPGSVYVQQRDRNSKNLDYQQGQSSQYQPYESSQSLQHQQQQQHRSHNRGYLTEESDATLDALRAQGARQHASAYGSNSVRGGSARGGSRSSRRSSGLKAPSPTHREKLQKWYNTQKKRVPILSRSASEAERNHPNREDTFSEGTASHVEEEEPMYSDLDEEYLKTRQSLAVLSILLTAGQLLILMLQLTMCGIATLDINPMVGPFPDAFSEWGGKNAYLMLYEKEWWRLLTPAFLHVGILHLLANAFCQLEAVALFEREWGSVRWLLVYIISTIGCQAFSSFFDVNTIGVGSSGSIMGMYSAKLAQITTITFFDVQKVYIDDTIRLDQLSSVLCGLTLVSLLSCITYIDWSGHMGGMLAGYLAGMVLFSYPIRSWCAWFFWTFFGLAGLGASLSAVLYNFIMESKPDEEIADPCEYFRSLFPEDYECGCMWQ